MTSYIWQNSNVIQFGDFGISSVSNSFVTGGTSLKSGLDVPIPWSTPSNVVTMLCSYRANEPILSFKR